MSFRKITLSANRGSRLSGSFALRFKDADGFFAVEGGNPFEPLLDQGPCPRPPQPQPRGRSVFFRSAWLPAGLPAAGDCAIGRAIPCCLSAPPLSPVRKIFVLKPDEIGDFILTTGCLRCLAVEFGEENLLLAVSKAAAPLARSQFPQATIYPLEFRRRRKVLNVTLVNIGLNWRVWRSLLFQRVEWALCLRSLRSYLHTVFFYTPRAGNYVACENLLSRQKRQRRPAVEAVAKGIFRPRLLPYPEVGAKAGVPTDLEANRLVASVVLGRELSLEEAWPRLEARVRETGEVSPWIFAPFSSSEKKDYPLQEWVEIFRALQPGRGERPLRLVAAGYQAAALQKWVEALRAAGLPKVEALPSVGLPELTDILAGAAFIFTVDTAAAHFACALRKPALILSAGHHPGVYGPYSPDGRQLWLSAPAGQAADALAKGWAAELPSERVVQEFNIFFGPVIGQPVSDPLPGVEAGDGKSMGLQSGGRET